MPSKVYAISTPSAAIALRYGKNVSKGILKMEDIIKGQQITIDLFRKERKPKGGFEKFLNDSGPSVRKLK